MTRRFVRPSLWVEQEDWGVTIHEPTKSVSVRADVLPNLIEVLTSIEKSYPLAVLTQANEVPDAD